MFSADLLLVAVVLLTMEARANRGGLLEYCFPNTFNASCGPTDVVLMKSSRYGRMKDGQCLSTTLHVGCWADVLNDVDRRCSGRHDCLINIPDTKLHNLQPCPKDMFAYLEAEYSCLPIYRDPSWSCHPMASLEVPGPSGYLASVTTVETGLGSRSCPWKINVSPGQRINVTLYDFGVSSRSAQSGSVCQVYAKIREKGMASEITICGAQTRERGVFVSETNEIEAMILTSQEEESPVYFVLKYEVVGCTDPIVPQGAWLKRSGDKAVIGCNYTTQAWHIVCHGNEWFGKVDNCSKVAPKPQSDGLASSKGDFPYGLMVAVITGLVLGVLIGVALLAMVIVCHKRYRFRKRRGPNPPTDPQEEVLETVQGTPFLRECKGNKPPETVDSGYGYTHVCDVTIYQPYAQQRQLSTFRGDMSKPPIEADNTQHQRSHDYEKPGFRKTSISGPGREARFYPDFDTDRTINTHTPGYNLMYKSDNKINSTCEQQHHQQQQQQQQQHQQQQQLQQQQQQQH